MLKAQKGTKTIDKIVHVTSVVQPKYYKNTFCVQKKPNKNNDFVQQFFSRESPCASILESTISVHSSACKQGAVHACSISSTTRRRACLVYVQESMHMHRGTLQNGA